MEEKKKSNRGGKRIAGEGKSLGRPKEIENGDAITVYLGEETKQVMAKLSTNASQAVRQLAEFWEAHQSQQSN